MNDLSPRVSVICLCYNHASYLKEAIDSVLTQSYWNIEIIIIDDFSTDRSREIIQGIASEHPEIKVILNEKNQGNCRSFNKAFRESTGDYVIDFSTDDIMRPERIECQVDKFSSLEDPYGVVYSAATFINKGSEEIGESNLEIHQGDVYTHLVRKYFVVPPTMMIRRQVLEDLGGYDEELSYEDFDFWVRSSRKYHYSYISEPLTLVRRTNSSHSSNFYNDRSGEMLSSTLRVCYKAFHLNQSDEDTAALKFRVSYEMRQALFTKNFTLVKQFFVLRKELGQVGFGDRVVLALSRLRISLSFLNKSARHK